MSVVSVCLLYWNVLKTGILTVCPIESSGCNQSTHQYASLTPSENREHDTFGVRFVHNAIPWCAFRTSGMVGCGFFGQDLSCQFDWCDVFGVRIGAIAHDVETHTKKHFASNGAKWRSLHLRARHVIRNVLVCSMGDTQMTQIPLPSCVG